MPVTLLQQGKLVNDTYGECSYKLYDACDSSQSEDPPLLFVWLHGAEMSDMPVDTISSIQSQLCRRTCFLIPLNPVSKPGGLNFNWGMCFTEEQDAGGLGWIFGELHAPFLNDLSGLIRQSSQEIFATAVWLVGYSMGGYGVYHLASHDPLLFDAAVPIAGYACGTLEPESSRHKAPQPASSHALQSFLDKYASQLAQVRALVAVHAERDAESSFLDAKFIVEHVRGVGGNAQLVKVPDALADSDPGTKPPHLRAGHRYYSYVLLTSRVVLYDRLDKALAQVEPQPFLSEPVVVDMDVPAWNPTWYHALLQKAVADVISKIAPNEKQWNGEKLQQRFTAYLRNAAKNLDFKKSTCDELIKEYALNFFGSLWSGCGDRDWIHYTDFTPVLCAAVKANFPPDAIATIARELFTNYEAVVAHASHAASDFNRYDACRWEAVRRIVSAKATQKKVSNALDVAREQTLQQQPGDIESFIQSWINATIEALAASGYIPSVLAQDKAAALFDEMINKGGGMPLALQQTNGRTHLDIAMEVAHAVEIAYSIYSQPPSGKGVGSKDYANTGVANMWFSNNRYVPY